MIAAGTHQHGILLLLLDVVVCSVSYRKERHRRNAPVLIIPCVEPERRTGKTLASLIIVRGGRF